MELHGGQLFVEWGWLTYLHRVPATTLNKGTARYRAGLVRTWENRPSPRDKRRVLIRYATIPLATQRKYGLPAEQTLLAEVRNRNLATRRLCVVKTCE